MKIYIPRSRLLITYVSLYLVFFAAAARSFTGLEDASLLPAMVGLLAFYLVLLIVEPFLIVRSLKFLHLVNGLQVAIALVLLLFFDKLDYFSLLLIPPCIQSVMRISLRGAAVWIGVIVLLMIPSLLVTFPFDEAIGYVIIYPTALFLFSALSYMARQAEEAQNRSEKLLADLQLANIKLQEYAAQVQELAAAEERNRLARELHDSVTQIIFSLTLSAQAARILINRDVARATAELDHLQSLAQSALAEMRTLIQELHPLEKTNSGLIPSLNQLVAERKVNAGLEINLQVNGTQTIPAPIERELFRIAQEAVNNIVKHAQVTHASITLDLNERGKVLLIIEDGGVGFDPAQVITLPGHLGLTSMTERVQALGGTLAVNSRPGQGTRLCVELSLEPEVAHD